MTYPYVQAAFDYGARKGPALAFVVHMAEGGGTVGYLSRDPARGVSVHYVIETTGRIVQMLREDRASGSINPADIRTTDDADRFFGATVRKSVMGAWDHDPNAAVISLEIEGYAVAGPNQAQHDSLTRLVNDVRSRYPKIGLLGHRDFANYKQCPGRHIDWAALGGHGPYTAPVTEDPVGVNIVLQATTGTDPLASFLTAKIRGAGHVIHRVGDYAEVAVADGLDLGLTQQATVDIAGRTWFGTDNRVLVFNYGDHGLFMARLGDCATAPLPVPVDATPYSKDDLTAAVTAAINHIAPKYAELGTAIKEATPV